eukprot:403356613
MEDSALIYQISKLAIDQIYIVIVQQESGDIENKSLQNSVCSDFLKDFNSKLNQKGEIDMKRLSYSFSKLLSEQVELKNDKYFPNHQKKNRQAQDDNEMLFDTAQSDSKLTNIEIELENIADGVRQNITSLFERGERFGILAQKSEQLKAQSRTIKARAKKVNTTNKFDALKEKAVFILFTISII